MGRPNATIHRAVEELIKESSIGKLSAKDGEVADSSFMDHAVMDQVPRGDAIDAALRSESFESVANALSVADISTKLNKARTHGRHCRGVFWAVHLGSHR